jgi:hypothetical protein
VSALNNLTAAQAEAVILHELAHIKRNDYIVNFVQAFIEMIMFFNPFVKILGIAVREERENCCDDWVLNYRYNSHEYATALLIVEKNRHNQVQLALAATSGKKNLLARIKRLLKEEPSVHITISQKIKLLSVSITILATILFILPVANRNANSIAKGVQGIALPAVSNMTAGLQTSIPKIISANEKPDFEKITAQNADLQVLSISDTTQAYAAEEMEYNTTALINEALLKQNENIQLQEMAIAAADIKNAPQKKLLVKIEEEQNGIKEKHTCYVELNNNNGVPEIKPLLILNEKAKSRSSKTGINKKIREYKPAKKRITT